MLHGRGLGLRWLCLGLFFGPAGDREAIPGAEHGVGRDLVGVHQVGDRHAVLGGQGPHGITGGHDDLAPRVSMLGGRIILRCHRRVRVGRTQGAEGGERGQRGDRGALGGPARPRGPGGRAMFWWLNRHVRASCLSTRVRGKATDSREP